jgi:hypothetical protein
MPATLPVTRAWTIPAAGKNTLAEILNNSQYVWVTYVSIRAGKNNAGDISWSDANGQAGGYLQPGEAAVVGDEYGSTQMVGFTFYGAAGDVLYLTVGVSLGNTWLG